MVIQKNSTAERCDLVVSLDNDSRVFISEILRIALEAKAFLKWIAIWVTLLFSLEPINSLDIDLAGTNSSYRTLDIFDHALPIVFYLGEFDRIWRCIMLEFDLLPIFLFDIKIHIVLLSFRVTFQCEVIKIVLILQTG